MKMNIPRVDSKEILHFVKNDDVLKRIVVVMFSTSSPQNDISYSYDNHVNCYIVKPANLPPFISSIQSTQKFGLIV
ncbi:MAG: hypothetical protein ABI472_02080 [Ginsengibacter sp.]